MCRLYPFIRNNSDVITNHMKWMNQFERSKVQWQNIIIYIKFMFSRWVWVVRETAWNKFIEIDKFWTRDCAMAKADAIENPSETDAIDRSNEEPRDVHRNYLSAETKRRYRNHSILAQRRYSFLSSTSWLHFKRWWSTWLRFESVTFGWISYRFLYFHMHLSLGIFRSCTRTNQTVKCAAGLSLWLI